MFAMFAMFEKGMFAMFAMFRMEVRPRLRRMFANIAVGLPCSHLDDGGSHNSSLLIGISSRLDSVPGALSSTKWGSSSAPAPSQFDAARIGGVALGAQTAASEASVDEKIGSSP